MSEEVKQWHENSDIISSVTAVMRNADVYFETTGGGTRHYVRDLLLPMLDDAGLQVIHKSAVPPPPSIGAQDGEAEAHGRFVDGETVTGNWEKCQSCGATTARLNGSPKECHKCGKSFKPEDGEKQEVPEGLLKIAQEHAWTHPFVQSDTPQYGYEQGMLKMWAIKQSEISSLKSRYEITSADWQTEVDAKNAEIELLRKNGASLRSGVSVLDVLEWAVKNNVRMESGYWRMDYSSIAYTDNQIVEQFLIEHPSLTLPQEQSELSAYREALQEYAGTEMSAIATAVLAKYEAQ
jgi:hypothetical protein